LKRFNGILINGLLIETADEFAAKLKEIRCFR
jgi:hypothetical protein